MSSRMERYYENDALSTGRSEKNKSLYSQIQNLDSYTNIEGVASIESDNEIDISRVKKMVDNRENYRKARELKSLLNEKEERIEEKEILSEEEKNYDINDLLSKVKKTESDNYRKLDEDSYKELKDIARKPKRYEEEIEVVEPTEPAEEIGENDDVGLLDDLKSNTIVGDAASIKKIIEEEKEQKLDTTEGVDKSFYTTNFGLTKKDFEDLKDLNEKVSKTNNRIMVMLMVIIIIIIIAFTVIMFS